MTGFATQIIERFNVQETDAGDESFNAKLKSFRATLRGVDDVKSYLLMVTKLYA